MMKNAYLNGQVGGAVRVIGFMIIFVILLEGVSVTFFSENTATRFNHRKRDAYSFLTEKPNTLQIIGVGNSDLYSGFSPLDLWKQFGYTSTICASPRQTIQDSRDMLEQVFETQSPDIVLIEADMFFDHNPDKVKGPEKANTWADFFDQMNPDYLARDIENYFSVFKFHNYWKGGSRNGKHVPYQSHGYKYNKICKLILPDYMKKTSRSEPMTRNNIKQADTLIALCKEKGADVIITVLPSVTSWNYERHNTVARYARERGVPFYDLNLEYDALGIDSRTSFRDNGNHLNYTGARAATAYLGKILEKNGRLRDLRDDPAYRDWDESLRQFEAFRQNVEQKTRTKKEGKNK